MQFDSNPGPGPTTQEMDQTVFEGGAPIVNPEDDLLSSLPKEGFRRAIQAAGGTIQRRDWIMTMNGLEYVGEQLTKEDWQEMGEWLTRLRDSIQWMIGDWANLGEHYMHQWVSEEELAEIESTIRKDSDIPEGKYKWLADLVDYKYGTLRNFALYAREFNVSRRRDTLTYSHHVEVARIKNRSQQDRLLDLAENGHNGRRLSVRELRELVQQKEGLLPRPKSLAQQSPIITSLIRIQQEISPERWKRMSKDERRQIHTDLKAMLLQMEELGFD
jgi:hypothetical protein